MPLKNRIYLVANFFTVFLFILVAPNYMQPALSEDLKRDPTEIRGPDACGECHKNSVELWKNTHHATTFQSLPRSDKAKEIAKAMGIRRIKNESDCLSCHFTSAGLKERLSL